MTHEHDPNDHADPDGVLAAFRDAARVEPVSPFATARAARALEHALDDEARARARWTSGRVAAVAMVAAASAGVLAFAIARAPAERVATAAPLAPPAVVAPAAAPSDARAEALPEAPPVVAPDALAAFVEASAVAPGPAVAPAVAPVRRVRRPHADDPVDKSERLVAAGDPSGAARVLLVAAGDDGAVALTLLARRHPEALSAIDDELARVRTTDVMRLRCQHRLLHARDRRAMEACRAFGQEHPQDGAARLLSFAAGRLAEDLGDLAWAEEEYSRSLLLSPFSGLSGTDALLARARVRFAAGDTEEARADLRLYLHSEPAARGEPAIATLAARLGL